MALREEDLPWENVPDLAEHAATSAEHAEAQQNSRPRKSRSVERRGRIRQEVQAKANFSSDIWQLQQQLVTPNVADVLMLAAKKLLPVKDYEAVVEERALEGLCGFPPCSQSLPEEHGKVWKINGRTHEVYKQVEVGMFCSQQCMKESNAFAVHLQPDPLYCRPDAAVAESRRAVAATRTTKEPVSEASAASKTSGAVAHDTSCANVEASIEQQEESASGGSCLPKSGRKKLPGVRKNAVVRFSRDNHTYSVDYGDYDGGGALADVARDPTTSSAGEANFQAPQASTRDGLVRKLVQASVTERSDAAKAVGSSACVEEGAQSKMDSCSDQASVATDKQAESASSHKGPKKVKQGLLVDADTSDESDAESVVDASSGEDFFEKDTSYPTGWCQSPFVMAWGVLTGWLSDLAREVLLNGTRLEQGEEGQPSQRARREMLEQVLSERLPGDLTFLAPRFHDLVSALSVHQTLPSITESDLYDLLAALLLRALYRADTARGSRDANEHCISLLDRLVDTAVGRLGISEAEVQTLDGLMC